MYTIKTGDQLKINTIAYYENDEVPSYGITPNCHYKIVSEIIESGHPQIDNQIEIIGNRGHKQLVETRYLSYKKVDPSLFVEIDRFPTDCPRMFKRAMILSDNPNLDGYKKGDVIPVEELLVKGEKYYEQSTGYYEKYEDNRIRIPMLGISSLAESYAFEKETYEWAVEVGDWREDWEKERDAERARESKANRIAQIRADEAFERYRKYCRFGSYD